MDQSTQTKVCRMCGASRPMTEFHRQAGTRDGRRTECIPCRREYRKRLRKMTPEEKAAPKLAALRRTHKVCTKCGEDKPLGEYRLKPTKSTDGHSTRCKTCEREYQREWAARDPAKRKQRAAEYYVQTRARQLSATKAARQRDAEKLAIRRQLRVAFAVIEGDQRCRKCELTKPVTLFPRNGKSANGRDYYCSECTNSARRDYYWENRDAELTRNRAWREANHALVREIKRAWRDANRERESATTAAWQRANAARVRQNRDRWRAANPDYYRDWSARNVEKVRAASRKYQQVHPEKNAESARRRRALERQAAIGEVDLDALWTGECSLCGDPIDSDLRWPDPLSKSIDHTIPLARGGTHEQSNLSWAHLICNMRKGCRMPE